MIQVWSLILVKMMRMIDSITYEEKCIILYFKTEKWYSIGKDHKDRAY